MRLINFWEKLNWVPLVFIIIVHFSSVLAFFPRFFSWENLLAFLILYVITGMVGITFGYHRMLTHCSFKAHKIIYIFALIAGMLAFQGNPIDWASVHRTHHYFSDQQNDPHDSSKGFWWSHMLWIFWKVPMTQKEIGFRKSLEKDKLLVFLSKFYVLNQIALVILLYSIGGFGMVIWGIFFRLAFVYHTTWFVNSATHKWGYRLFDSPDRSKNNWWVALLTFGEGWHNTHHHSQSSPRHGIMWWEIDATWMLIKFLETVGLVSNLKPIPDKP